jgi:CO/xanthine dehydrogenase FAD-binding subunit
MSDAHVTADYRLHLAGVVSKRALAEAGQIAELPA